MKIIIAILIATTFIGFINCANKCYLCDHCPEPFIVDMTNSTALDFIGVSEEKCAEKNYDCMTVERKGNSFIVVSRGCKKDCRSGTTNEDGMQITTTCCKGDMCNDSTRLNQSFAMLALAMAFVLSKA